MLSDVAQGSVKQFYDHIKELPEGEVEAFSAWVGHDWYESGEFAELIDKFNQVKVGEYRSLTDFAEEKRDELLAAASSSLEGQGGLSGGPAFRALRDLAANVDINAYIDILEGSYLFFRLSSGSVFVTEVSAR